MEYSSVEVETSVVLFLRDIEKSSYGSLVWTTFPCRLSLSSACLMRPVVNGYVCKYIWFLSRRRVNASQAVEFFNVSSDNAYSS